MAIEQDAVDRERLSGFYFITDSRLTVNGILEDVRQALEAGVAVVQYREKEKGFAERLHEAETLVALCREWRVPFIVNDDIDLAGKVGADGVHVGPQDAPPADARKALGPQAIVGVSIGSASEVAAAAASGVTYVAASPVFETPTKPDAGPGMGAEGVRRIRAAISLPVVAIGGLSAANVREVAEAGADMICAISASLAGGKVADNIAALLEAAGLPTRSTT
jgi:thiamine-phosphate pyrophosphorylase